MRPLTAGRAAPVAAMVAVVVFLPSLANGWAGDDTLVVEVNRNVHSVGAALRAWFDTYWQPPFRDAGLYRPLAILTYAVDWSLSGGAPWWFHLTNVLLHGVVTGLLVLVLAAWMRPSACLVAGLLFAIHPVHVEAVANVVGRAELLVTIGLFGAVLAARRYRAARSSVDKRVWLAVSVIIVALALHAKESAIIALPLIILDQALEPQRDRRLYGAFYLSIAAVTLVWFHVWNSIAGAYVGSGAHGAWFGTSTGHRLATMFPAYLDLLRLLTVPIDLSSDYSPMVVPVRRAWSWGAMLGLASTTAFVAIGFMTVRRAPAVAFAVFLTVMSYAPVSNLFFPSGVILSERGLYLGITVPAVVGGMLFSAALARRRARLGVGVLSGVLAAYALISVDRIPFWRDALNPILEERAAHPENYRNRFLLSEYLSFTGDTTRALSEMLLAAELYPADPSIHMYASRLAVSEGRPVLAVRKAEEAFEIHPTWVLVQETLVVALLESGMSDSARSMATEFMHLTPTSGRTAETLSYVMDQTAAPEWQRYLARARRDWLGRDLVRARAVLDSAVAVLPDLVATPAECRFLEPMIPMTEWIMQDLATQLDGMIESSRVCRANRGAR